ncbi:MAG: transglutaminase family protein [Gemmatimonadaceae bacterium]|nr:transglutaminase family protein [Chitinophagaceae bacterium]
MPRFNIQHITSYIYEGPVRDSANQIILYPLQDEFQEVHHQEIRITGDPQVEVYRNYYGNLVGSFMHAEPHSTLVINSKVEVFVKSRPMPSDEIPAPQQWQQLHEIRHHTPYIDFLKQENVEALPEIESFAALQSLKVNTPLHAANHLTTLVYENFTYIKGITDVETTLNEIWKLRAGVCQDFAHMLLAMLRLLEIPARYVSGYICPNKNGMRGEGATHAWVEAYIPYFGWVGFDPTNNCITNDLHVRLATGRSFSDVSPVKGTYKGTAAHTLEVGVSVSYENGETIDAPETILTPQPNKNGESISNSYRRHMEMMQQQQ